MSLQAKSKQPSGYFSRSSCFNDFKKKWKVNGKHRSPSYLNELFHMCFFEFLHAINQSLDAFFWHGVVDRCAESAH